MKTFQMILYIAGGFFIGFAAGRDSLKEDLTSAETRIIELAATNKLCTETITKFYDELLPGDLKYDQNPRIRTRKEKKSK